MRRWLPVLLALKLAVLAGYAWHQHQLIREYDETLTAIERELQGCRVVCPAWGQTGHPDARQIVEAALEANVPPWVLLGIATVETRYNTDPPRGRDGEIGRLQVMPFWTEAGALCGDYDLEDAEQGLRCGAAIARWCYDRQPSPSWTAAVQCYNRVRNETPADRARRERYLREVERRIGEMVLRSVE